MVTELDSWEELWSCRPINWIGSWRRQEQALEGCRYRCCFWLFVFEERFVRCVFKVPYRLKICMRRFQNKIMKVLGPNWTTSYQCEER